MAKSTFHSQFEDEIIYTPERGSIDTTSRVLRRLVLEILEPLSLWTERHKGPVAFATIQAVRNNPDLYENAEGWKEILEEFLDKNLELVGLKRPLELPEILKAKRNPLTDRIVELGQKVAKDTILIGWHRNHGPVALSWPAPRENLRVTPQGKVSGKNSDLPISPLTKVILPWPNNPEEEPLALWLWDKKNFC